MKKSIQKTLSILVVIATVFGGFNLPINAETTANNEETSVENEVQPESTENIEESVEAQEEESLPQEDVDDQSEEETEQIPEPRGAPEIRDVPSTFAASEIGWVDPASRDHSWGNEYVGWKYKSHTTTSVEFTARSYSTSGVFTGAPKQIVLSWIKNGQNFSETFFPGTGGLWTIGTHTETRSNITVRYEHAQYAGGLAITGLEAGVQYTLSGQYAGDWTNGTSTDRNFETSGNTFKLPEPPKVEIDYNNIKLIERGEQHLKYEVPYTRLNGAINPLIIAETYGPGTNYEFPGWTTPGIRKSHTGNNNSADNVSTIYIPTSDFSISSPGAAYTTQFVSRIDASSASSGNGVWQAAYTQVTPISKGAASVKTGTNYIDLDVEFIGLAKDAKVYIKENISGGTYSGKTLENKEFKNPINTNSKGVLKGRITGLKSSTSYSIRVDFHNKQNAIKSGNWYGTTQGLAKIDYDNIIVSNVTTDYIEYRVPYTAPTGVNPIITGNTVGPNANFEVNDFDAGKRKNFIGINNSANNASIVRVQRSSFSTTGPIYNALGAPYTTQFLIQNDASDLPERGKANSWMTNYMLVGMNTDGGTVATIYKPGDTYIDLDLGYSGLLKNDNTGTLGGDVTIKIREKGTTDEVTKQIVGRVAGKAPKKVDEYGRIQGYITGLKPDTEYEILEWRLLNKNDRATTSPGPIIKTLKSTEIDLNKTKIVDSGIDFIKYEVPFESPTWSIEEPIITAEAYTSKTDFTQGWGTVRKTFPGIVDPIKKVATITIMTSEWSPTGSPGASHEVRFGAQTNGKSGTLWTDWRRDYTLVHGDPDNAGTANIFKPNANSIDVSVDFKGQVRTNGVIAEISEDGGTTWESKTLNNLVIENPSSTSQKGKAKGKISGLKSNMTYKIKLNFYNFDNASFTPSHEWEVTTKYVIKEQYKEFATGTQLKSEEKKEIVTTNTFTGNPAQSMVVGGKTYVYRGWRFFGDATEQTGVPTNLDNTSNEKVIEYLYDDIGAIVTFTANNISVNYDDRSTLEIGTNSNKDIINLSDAKAEDIRVTPAVPLNITPSLNANNELNAIKNGTKGTSYPITLQTTIGGQDIERIVYVYLKDVNEEVDMGAEYLLTATHFEKDRYDVAIDKQSQLSYANGTIIKLSDNTKVNVLDTDITVTSSMQQDPATYPIKFETTHTTETDLTVTIDGILSNMKPLIQFSNDSNPIDTTFVDIKEVAQGSVVDVMEDVTLLDEEVNLGDLKITADGGDVTGTTLDTTNEGYVTVIYNFKDVKQEKAVERKRIYKIGGTIPTTKYDIVANGFNQKVETTAITKADLKDKTNLSAINLETGHIYDPLTEIDMTFDSDLGIKVGNFDVDFEIKDATIPAGSEKIEEKVLVTITPTDDPKRDNDVLVDAADVELLPSEIISIFRGTNKQLMNDTLQAVGKDEENNVVIVTPDLFITLPAGFPVTMNDFTGLDGEVYTADVTAKAQDGRTSTKPVSIKVKKTNAPTIVATPNVENLPIGSPTLTRANLLTGITAKDYAGNTMTDGDITITGDTVLTGTEGIYVVVYTVTSEGKTAQTARIYNIGDKIPPTPGKDYFVDAQSFTHKYTTNAENTKFEILSRANAKLINNKTGEIFSDLTDAAVLAMFEEVGLDTVKPYDSQNPGRAVTSTTYDLTIKAVDNGNDDHEIKGTVTNTAPIINLDVQSQAVTLNDAAITNVDDFLKANITVSDAEEGNLTLGLEINNGHGFDVSKKGIYDVTYTVEDEHGLEDTKVKTFVVGAIAESNDYILYAESFTHKKLPTAPTDVDDYILDKSNAKSIAIADNTDRKDAVVTVNHQNYDGTEEGLFKITLSTIDNGDSGDIYIHVTSDDPHVEDNITLDGKDFKISKTVANTLTTQELANLARAGGATSVNMDTNTNLTNAIFVEQSDVDNVKVAVLDVQTPIKLKVTENGKTYEKEVNVTVYDTAITMTVNDMILKKSEVEAIAALPNIAAQKAALITHFEETTLHKGNLTYSSTLVPTSDLKVHLIDAQVTALLTNIQIDVLTGKPFEITVADDAVLVNANDQTSKTVRVYIKDDNTTDFGFQIISPTFNIALKDANDFEKVVNASGVIVSDLRGTTPEPIQDPITAGLTTPTVITTIGDSSNLATYGQDFTFVMDNDSETVKANVFNYYNGTKKVGINGHAFSMKLSDATSVGALKTAASVEAFDVTAANLAVPRSISSNMTAASLPQVVGDKLATIETTDAGFETSNFTVMGTYTDKEIDDGAFRLNGNDFLVSKEEAESATINTIALDRSKVHGYDVSTQPETPLGPGKYKVHGTLPTTVGEHTVGFVLDSSVTAASPILNVKMTVKDKLDPLDPTDPTDKSELGANHFTARLGEIAPRDNDIIKTKAGVEGKDKQGNVLADASPEIVVSKVTKSGQTANISTIVDTGSYDVTFIITGTNKTVTVTMLLVDTHIDLEVQDVRILLADVAGLTNPNLTLDALVSVSNAHTGNTPSTEVKAADFTAIKAITAPTPAQGAQAELNAKDGDDTTEANFNVHVYDEGSKGLDYEIYANNFRIKKADVTLANAIKKAGATAWDVTSKPHTNADNLIILSDNLGAQVPDSDLPTEVGTHTIYLAVDGSSPVQVVSVEMEIFDEGNEVPTVGTINANNFKIILQNAQNEQKVKDLSGVKAKDADNNPLLQSSIKLETDLSTITTLGTKSVTFYIEENGLKAKVTVEMNVVDYDVISGDEKEALDAKDVVLTVSEYAALVSDQDLAGSNFADAKLYDLETPNHDLKAEVPTVAIFDEGTTTAPGSMAIGTYDMQFKSTAGLELTRKLKIKDDYDIEDADHGINAKDVVMTVSEFNSLTDLKELAVQNLGNPVQYDKPANTPSSLQPTWGVTQPAGTLIIGAGVVGEYTVEYNNGTIAAPKKLTIKKDYDKEDTTHGIDAKDVVMTVTEFNSLTDLKELAVQNLGDPVQYDKPANLPTALQPTWGVTEPAGLLTLGNGAIGEYTVEYSNGTIAASKKLSIKKDYDVEDTTHGIDAKDVVMTVSEFNSLTAFGDLKATTLGNPVQYDKPANTKSTPQPAWDIVETSGTLAIGAGVVGDYRVTYSNGTIAANKELKIKKDYDQEDANHGIDAENVTMTIDEFNLLTDLKELAVATLGNPVQYDKPGNLPTDPQPTWQVDEPAGTLVIGSGVEGNYTITYGNGTMSATKQLSIKSNYDVEDTNHGITAKDVVMTETEFNALTDLKELAVQNLGNPVQYDKPANTPSVTQPTWGVTQPAGTLIIGAGVVGEYTVEYSNGTIAAPKKLTIKKDYDKEDANHGIDAKDVVMTVSEFNSLTDLKELAVQNLGNPVQFDKPANLPTDPQPTWGVTEPAGLLTLGNGAIGEYTVEYSNGTIAASKKLSIKKDYDAEDAVHGIDAKDVVMTLTEFNSLTSFNDLKSTNLGNPVQYDKPANTKSSPQPTWGITETTGVLTIGAGSIGEYKVAYNNGTIVAEKKLTIKKDYDKEDTTHGIDAKDVVMTVTEFNALTDLKELAVQNLGNPVQYDKPANLPTDPQPTWGVTQPAGTLVIGAGVVGEYTVEYSNGTIAASKKLTIKKDYDKEDATHGIDAKDVVMTLTEFNALTSLNDLAVQNLGNPVQFDKPANTPSVTQPTWQVTQPAGTLVIGAGVVGEYTVEYSNGTIAASKKLTIKNDYDVEDANHGIIAKDVVMTETEFNALTDLKDLAVQSLGNPVQYDKPANTPSVTQPTWGVTQPAGTLVIGAGVVGEYTVEYSNGTIAAPKKLTIKKDYDKEDATHGIDAKDVVMTVTEFNALTSLNDLAVSTLGNPVQFNKPANLPSSTQPTWQVTQPAGTLVIGAGVVGEYTVEYSNGTIAASKKLTIKNDYDVEDANHGIIAKDVVMTETEFNALTDLKDLAVQTLGNPVQYDKPANTPSVTQPTWGVTEPAGTLVIGAGVVGEYTVEYSNGTFAAPKKLTIKKDYDKEDATHGIDAKDVVMTETEFNALTSLNDLSVATLGNPVQFDKPANTPSVTQPTWQVTQPAGTLVIGAGVVGEYTVEYSNGTIAAAKKLTIKKDYDKEDTTHGIDAKDVVMTITEFNALTSLNDLAVQSLGNPEQYDKPANNLSNPQPTWQVNDPSGTLVIGAGVEGNYAVEYNNGTIGAVKQLSIKKDYDVEDATHGIDAFDVTMTVTEFNALTSLNDLAVSTLGNPVQYDKPANTPSNLQPTWQVTQPAGTLVIGAGVVGTYTVEYSNGTIAAQKQLTIKNDYDVEDANHGITAKDVTMTVTEFNTLTSLNDLSVSTLGNPVQYDKPANLPSSTQPTWQVTQPAGTLVIGAGVVGTYTVEYSNGTIAAPKQLTIKNDYDVEDASHGIIAKDVVMTVSEFNTLTNLDDLSVSTLGNPVQYDKPANTPSSMQPTWQVTQPAGTLVIGAGVVGEYTVEYSNGTIAAPKKLTIKKDYDNEDVTHGIDAKDVTMTISAFNALTNLNDLSVSTLGNPVQFDKPANLPSSTQPTWVVTEPAGTLVIGAGIEGNYTVEYSNGSIAASKQLTIKKDYDVEDASHGIDAKDVTMTVTEFNALTSLKDLAVSTLGNPVQYDKPANTLSNPQPTWQVTEPAGTLVVGAGVVGEYTVRYSNGTIAAPKKLTIKKDYDVEDATHGIDAQDVTMKVSVFNALTNLDDLAVPTLGNPIQYDKPANLPSSTQPTWAVTEPAGTLVIGAGSVGTYTVEYSNGTIAASKQLEIVADGIVLPPVISAIAPGTGSTIKGTSEANMEITITLPDTTTLVTTADSSGNWSTTNPGLLTPGQVVTAVAKDLVTTVVSTQAQQTVGNWPAVAAPVIHPLNYFDTQVTGTAEAGKTVEVTVDGVLVDTVVADSQGNWIATVPSLQPAQVVGAQAKDLGTGVSSTITTAVVPNFPAVAAPTINDMIDGDTTISGTGIAGKEIIVELPDGTFLPAVTVATDGTWEVTLPNPAVKDEVYGAIQKDPATNVESSKVTTTVQAEVEKTYTMTAKDVTFTLEEFTKLKADGKLEEKILKDSEAKVVENTTNQEVGPLLVDATLLKAADVKVGDKHKASIIYEVPTNNGRATTTETRGLTRDEIVAGKITKEITVTITKGGKTLPDLPVTGENVLELLLLAAIVFVGSFTFFLFGYRRKNKNDE